MKSPRTRKRLRLHCLSTTVLQISVYKQKKLPTQYPNHFIFAEKVKYEHATAKPAEPAPPSAQPNPPKEERLQPLGASDPKHYEEQDTKKQDHGKNFIYCDGLFCFRNLFIILTMGPV